MSINKFRSILYKIAKYSGDVQALSSGSPKKIGKRVGRRVVGKFLGRGMGKLFK